MKRKKKVPRPVPKRNKHGETFAQWRQISGTTWDTPGAFDAWRRGTNPNNFVRKNPMTKNEKIASYAAVGGAVLLGGALLYHFTSTANAATSGSGSGSTHPAVWTRVATGGTVPSGARVRMSITQLNFQQFASALGLQNTLAGFGDYINSLHVAPTIQIYGPAPVPGSSPPQGYPLRPSDWPADDTLTQTEYSADFTYTGAASYPVVNGISTWILTTSV